MNPHDPAARLSLAAVLVAQHREIEALATLDEFSRGTLNSEVIVRAIDIARTVAPSQVVKRQRELVRSLPGSLAGAEALVELDAEGSTPDADRLYLAGLVVAAQPADALLLPEAALALARRGDVATAQRAIERSTTVDRAMWTAAVQIAGGTTTPQSSYAKVCSVVPAGHEWDCLALSQALKRSDRRFTLYVNPADRAVANNFASRVAQHATACSNRNRGGKLTASLVVERGQVRALAGWGSHCLGEALERTEGPPRLTMQLDIDLYAGAPALAAFHDQPHRRVPALREPPEPREQPPTATREQPDGGSTGYLAAFDREADARTIGIEGRAVIPLSARGWSFALDGGVGAGADALEVAGNIMVGRSSALSHGILGTVSLGSGFSSIGETRAPTVLADVRLRASDTILWLRATHIFEGEDMGFASTHFEAAIGHTFGGTVFAALRFEERDSDPAIGLAIGFAPFGGTY